MNVVSSYLRALRQESIAGWNRFWFSREDPATLGLIRICAGAMLLYTHAVYTIDLIGFAGPEGRISMQFAQLFHDPLERGHWAWSYLQGIESPAILWSLHIGALVVFALLTLGFWTRVVSVLAFVITVSYVHRFPGALFGLDQVNTMLALYLMVGPCGAAYSLDRWRALRRGRQKDLPSVSCNIAIRLMQIHLCVIYIFAGLGKLQGVTWWEGTAIWLSIANYEYQSIDVTVLGRWPFVINALTHISLFWEISYAALVWPRITRPIVIGLAVPLHLGIAVCLGMITFGLAMLIANLSFVSPALVRHAVDAVGHPLAGHAVKGQGRGVQTETSRQTPSRARR